MKARTFALVFAALSGVPLLCAALLWLCPSDTVAVLVCLALAGCGGVGAVASILLLAHPEGVR